MLSSRLLKSFTSNVDRGCKLVHQSRSVKLTSASHSREVRWRANQKLQSMARTTSPTCSTTSPRPLRRRNIKSVQAALRKSTGSSQDRAATPKARVARVGLEGLPHLAVRSWRRLLRHRLRPSHDTSMSPSAAGKRSPGAMRFTSKPAQPSTSVRSDSLPCLSLPSRKEGRDVTLWWRQSIALQPKPNQRSRLTKMAALVNRSESVLYGAGSIQIQTKRSLKRCPEPFPAGQASCCALSTSYTKSH